MSIQMKMFSSKTFDYSKSVCEHIMEISDMVVQLKSLEIEIFESFLVHFIIIFLLNIALSKYLITQINKMVSKWTFDYVCSRGREIKTWEGGRYLSITRGGQPPIAATLAPFQKWLWARVLWNEGEPLVCDWIELILTYIYQR